MRGGVVGLNRPNDAECRWFIAWIREERIPTRDVAVLVP
jgi:hypothetical protein